MRAEESTIFGAIADGTQAGGQGLIVRTQIGEHWTAQPPPEIGRNELSYLAYGCADLNGALRPAIQVGATAAIELFARTAQDHIEVAIALERWLLFGNLGAKARRGWGSLSDGRWGDATAIERALHSHVKSGDPTTAPWSSLFGATSHLRVCAPGLTWSRALDELGGIFHQFRKDLGADKISSGGAFIQKPGKPCGIDHDRVANWLNGTGMMAGADRVPTLPDRIGFGLPLPMQFSRGGKPVFEPDPTSKSTGDRRASPLIFKLHRVGDRYVGVVTILGGRFLPEGVQVQGREGHKKLQLPVAARPKVLDDFASCLRIAGFTEIKA